MRIFTENDSKKYLKYSREYVFDEEYYDLEIKGHCHMCGVFLSETKLPKGLESEFCCENCLEMFIESFEELEELGEFKK